MPSEIRDRKKQRDWQTQVLKLGKEHTDTLHGMCTYVLGAKWGRQRRSPHPKLRRALHWAPLFLYSIQREHITVTE